MLRFFGFKKKGIIKKKKIRKLGANFYAVVFDFAGSRSSSGVSHILVTPSVARGVTPFMPLRGRTSALGEGQDTPAHSDGVARRPSVLRKIGAQQNTSAAVGGEWSRALIGYRKGGGKSSADGLQMRLRAERSPPHMTESAARRQSLDASFSEARGVDRYSATFWEKIELE